MAISTSQCCIAMFDSYVPVHAEHAGELRVGAGKASQSHQRVRARETEQTDESRQLRRRVVQNDAAAGVDHRPLRVEKQLAPLLDLPAWPLVTGLYERIAIVFG
jgi:hypothetical protein